MFFKHRYILIFLIFLALPLLELYLWVHCLATGIGNNSYVLEPKKTIYRLSYFPNQKSTKSLLFRTNALGLRGKDIKPNENLLLFVGGSTTLCYALDDSETWPAQVAQSLASSGLKNKHLNPLIAARGGFLSHHYALVVEKILPNLQRSANRVLALFILPGANELESWCLNVQYPNLTPEIITSSAFSITPLLHNRVPIWFYRPSIKNTLFYHYARNLGNNILSGLHLQEGCSTTEHTTEELQEYRARAVKIRPDEAKIKLLEQYKNVYRDNLIRIAKIAEQYGIPVYFISQPILYNKNLSPALLRLWTNGAVNQSYHTPNDHTKYYTEESMYDALSQFNQITLEVAQNTHSHFIDAASLLRDDTDLYIDQWHFNPYGGKHFGSLIATQVIRDFQ